MVRKTDDNVILQMLREGKTQKEIAEHFGVSPAAICKRCKKLLGKKPESFDRLTKRQQKFALAISEGKTQTQAALDSHECSSLDSDKNVGSQLMARPDIQTAVAELMQEEGLTRRYRVQKLKGHVDAADPNVSLKALDQSWKLDGAYTEKHVHVHTTYPEMLQKNAEIQAKVRAFEEKFGIETDTMEGEVVEDKGD